MDATLRQLMTSLMTHIVYVDHVRRYERYWAGDNPRQLPFRETTYEKGGGRATRERHHADRLLPPTDPDVTWSQPRRQRHPATEADRIQDSV